MTPGQATAYKIGMIKLQQLRAAAQAELGDKFDIRAFHDTVLGGGACRCRCSKRVWSAGSPTLKTPVDPESPSMPRS